MSTASSPANIAAEATFDQNLFLLPRSAPTTEMLLRKILTCMGFACLTGLRYPRTSSSRIFYGLSIALYARRLKVALTREEGTNDKLAVLLPNFDCIELPCLAFEKMDATLQLDSAIKAHDAVVLTSPQSVNVFLEAWFRLGKPAIKVATVGKGTSKPLISSGIIPIFEPSEALGAVLAKELPLDIGILTSHHYLT